jgi:DNA-binding transcriptional MerR regulator
MLRIGQFSRITGITIQALRYYEALGLLRPAAVDPSTGYRWYAFDQLPRMHRILALKDLGLSLEEVARFLAAELPAAEMLGMLRLKEAELREKTEEDLDRLARVRARLRQLEEENIMPDYDIVLKPLDPLRVAGVRAAIPAYPEQGPLWAELGAWMEKRKIQAAGPCLAVYYADDPEIDAEACEQVAGEHPTEGRVKVHMLPPAELAACAVHSGPFSTIGEAYGAVAKWMEANGYSASGPVREVYLQVKVSENGTVSHTDPNTVTEIQLPVKKG